MPKRRFVPHCIIVAWTVITSLTTGCSSTLKDEPVSIPSQNAITTKITDEKLVTDKRFDLPYFATGPVATIDGVEVDAFGFNEYVRKYVRRFRANPGVPIDSDAALKNFIDESIIDRLGAQHEAEEIPDDVVETLFLVHFAMQAFFAGKDGAQKNLEIQCDCEGDEAMKAHFKKGMKIDKFLVSRTPNIDARAKEVFDANPSDYQHHETFEYEAITFATPPMETVPVHLTKDEKKAFRQAASQKRKKAQKDALQSAKDLRREITPDNFDEYMDSHNGTVERRTKQTPKALIGTKLGEITGPFNHFGKYVIARLKKIEPERPKTYEEVKSHIQATILAKERDEVVAAVVAKERAERTIVTHPSSIEINPLFEWPVPAKK